MWFDVISFVYEIYNRNALAYMILIQDLQQTYGRGDLSKHTEIAVDQKMTRTISVPNLTQTERHKAPLCMVWYL